MDEKLQMVFFLVAGHIWWLNSVANFSATSENVSWTQKQYSKTKLIC